MVRSGQGKTGRKNHKGEKEMELIKMLARVCGAWIAAYLICGGVHEGSHVVAGLVQGWKFELLVIGPFKLYRDEKDDKVKFGLEKNLVLWGGIGGSYPRKWSDKVIKQFAWVLLAGPVSSIILGLLCLIPLFFKVSIFWAMMAFVPLGMGIMCLIPTVKTGILYSDGGRFLRIIKGGKTYAEEKAIFEAAMVGRCEGCDEYDEEGINIMIASRDKAFQYLGHYYGYVDMKEKGRDDEAQAHLGSMKAIEGEVPKTVIEMCVIE